MANNTKLKSFKEQLQKVIVGQESLLDQLIIALLAEGHVLLEGAPGLAKTTIVHALASGIDAEFQRIQFTPDLMPADITGSDIYQTDDAKFHFVRGPLFHQILLADEINRAPPKVQSALLEAMAEHQVTVGANTHALPDLFMVLATQNPLEQSGTFELPEAQLDRFLFKLMVDYPTIEEEIEISRRARKAHEGHVEDSIKAVLSPENVLQMRQEVNSVFVELSIEKYAVTLVSSTRNIAQYIPNWDGFVKTGASPRASIALLRSAMAKAYIDGRDYVLPEDVISLAPDVLRHRIVMDFVAQAEGVTVERIINALLNKIVQP